MTDFVRDRLTFEPKPEPLAPIPWPQHLAPKVIDFETAAGHPLPSADVLVVTWTAAEFRALADVLTPGHASTDWNRYEENWVAYTAQLTDRSPARQAGCLGQYALTKIGTKRVLCFHSELHLATDGDEPPIVRLWQQIVPEVSPELVITTGTAGATNTTTSLGDVFVTNSAKFNCTRSFAAKPWAQKHFVGPARPTAGTHIAQANNTLVAANAGRLRPEAIRDPRIAEHGDVETVDFFAFVNTDDSYDILKNDATASTEEMDDATLPLALSSSPMAMRIPWLSIRNASDPVVSSSIGDLEAQAKWASSIYERYGYWTTVGSAIGCWAVISDLP